MRPRAALACACVALAAAAQAQAPGVQRTLLQRIDVGEGLELVVAIAEVAPGHAIGRHTHHGVESGYVLAGEAEMTVEGEAPRRVRTGDSFVIPAGRVHDARAVGDRPARVVASFVVQKGKPLATPAP